MGWTRSGAILLRALFSAALCGWLVGCQPPRTGAPLEAGPDGGAGQAPLPSIPVPGAIHYVVDAPASDVQVFVYRGGPLASAGHNHVVRVHGITGDIYLAEPFSRSAFQLAFPVVAMEVDPQDARAAAGADFSTALSPEAIAATWRNMIGPAVLDAARFPDVRLDAVSVTGTPEDARLTTRITLHGVSRDVPVPVHVTMSQSRLQVSGEFELQTSTFGITPFSVLGGGLRVEDLVRIRIQLDAVTAGTDGAAP